MRCSHIATARHGRCNLSHFTLTTCHPERSPSNPALRESAGGVEGPPGFVTHNAVSRHSHRIFLTLLLSLLLLSCSHHSSTPLTPKAYGTQIVEVSGSKQIATVGSSLPQPVVVQVNDANGNAIVGALVHFHGEGVEFNPSEALSDSSGQVSTAVQTGFAAGDYQLVAETPKQGGGSASINLREIALGYEGTLGKAVNDKYCIRCHDSESTPERVSNFDNLSPAPHQFADGATYNRLQDADLINITSHGGPALGKSPQMPAFGATLKPAEIKAVVSYIRSIADPPYQTSGVKYAK